MINTEHINRLAGGNAKVLDSEGNKIGSVGQLYLDDRTEDPNWVTVKTGLFGTSETFVPLSEATSDGDDIRVPYSKDQIKDAPRVDPDGHLSPADEERLYSHYSLGGGTYAAGTTGTYSDARTGTAGTDRTEKRGAVGHDTSGPTTDDAMTLSEERLDVGTRSEEVGRARLRKYVVTENVTESVPVTREEVRLEREPITDANIGNALDGPAISEEEHEVTLHAERAVVDKEAVPVERVRLDKTTVTDQEQVSENLRKEEIEVDGDTTRDRRI